MKKIFLSLLMALAFAQGASAQSQSFGLFDHLALGASIGTDGIGFDVAAPITDYGGLRAGVSFWPKAKLKTDIDINDNSSFLEPTVDIEGKVNIFDVKLLADLYPLKGCSFHLTVGAFYGKEKVLTATNTSMFIKDPSKYGKLGLMVGNYRVTTDQNGYITADAKVNAFKPYLGIGFGRAVPRKNRINVACDLGVQFWGKAKLGAMTKDDWGNEYYHTFKKSDLDDYDDEDIKDAIDFADKLTVFPVINVRISGRIF
ncbi:MAG: hypothetical protein J5552_04815 [Prevotella sp.]|nr:hypothetical protein [Prevotella sp.]